MDEYLSEELLRERERESERDLFFNLTHTRYGQFDELFSSRSPQS